MTIKYALTAIAVLSLAGCDQAPTSSRKVELFKDCLRIATNDARYAADDAAKIVETCERATSKILTPVDNQEPLEYK